MSVAERASGRDVGRLANNGILVRSLQSALSRAETGTNAIVGTFRHLIKMDAWREFILTEDPEQHVHQWNAADFRVFLEAKRPRGLESSIPLVRKLLAATDIADPFEVLVRGEPGGNPGGPHNPAGANQWTNRNIVTDGADDTPITIPLPVAEPRPRDYSRESKQGNATGYALRRLERNRPDLLEKVKEGDLTPNAAMVAAGFRVKAITIEDDPERAVRRLVRHFAGDRLEALLTRLADWAGYELVKRT